MKALLLGAFLPLAVTLLSCGSAPAATDCQRFRQGSFLYHLQGEDKPAEVLITRNDSIQTERYLQTGDVSRLAIRWTSPCTYELRLLTSTLHFSPAVEESRRRNVLRTEIVKTAANYCIFRSKRDHVDFMMTDTLWIKK